MLEYMLQGGAAGPLKFRVLGGGRLADMLWEHLEAIGATEQTVDSPEIVFNFRDTRSTSPGFEGPRPSRMYSKAHYVRCFISQTHNAALQDERAGVVDETLDLEADSAFIRRCLRRTLEI